KDLMREHEIRIRSGMIAYEYLQRLRDGETHRVKVYDNQAPARNREPTREVSRAPTVERTVPQPAR
ncbi:hypothetical protein CLD22_28120, partial [Rubrivivax gelatinosus]|nr:hypothetical protein [Rubrivivax gelatinosus]